MERMEGGYLFVHFTGESPEGEQVYFALSRDGLRWGDLNGGRPVLWSDVGEKGIRDPFVLRSEIDGCFYIIATDLRIAEGKGWNVAQYEGSTKMVVWKSEDLISWSSPWTVDVSVPGAGCVWAPEAIYDSGREEYLVFWASMVKEAGETEGKQRIYASYTRDFVSFTEPVKYIEREHHVIDTTIMEEDGVYYRFSKDETTKNIRVDCGRELMGEFAGIQSDVLDELMGAEGPAVFPLRERGKWCLIVDRFAENLGYLPLICTDLKKCDFVVQESGEYDMGENCKRHGSVLVLNEKEYQRLEAHFEKSGGERMGN